MVQSHKFKVIWNNYQFLVNFRTCDVMHRMMPSHHHSPLTICTKRLIKCLMCHIWRLLTDPRSLLTTTRRMLRHSSDCTHRDTSVRSAAQCLRIQATNAAILGLPAPRVTSRWSSVIFAPQALNHNGFCEFTWSYVILQWQTPWQMHARHVRDVDGRSFLIRFRMKASFE